MKGKLFGGMKVKGPSAKQQQTKKQEIVSISQTSLKSKAQQPMLEHKAATNSQHRDEVTQPQIKPAKASIQPSVKQQHKHDKKQSLKQPSSKRSSSSNVQKQTPLQPSDKTSQKQQEQLSTKKEQPSARKDFTKSRSQKNYDGEDSEDNNDVREDRSVVVGRPQEKEEIEIRKEYKGKQVVTGPKSNPLLNQIKKISSKAGTQQSKEKQQQILGKQGRQKGGKVSSQSTKAQQRNQQKPRRQKSSIMQQLYSSHSRILQLLIKKKQAKHQIITITTHILQLKQQLSTLTQKQNHYISSEQYELADKLQGKITQVTEKIAEQEVQIGFVQEQLFKLELEGVNVLRQHLEQEKRTVRRLKLVELDIEDQIAHYKRQEEEKIEISRSSSDNQKKKYQRIVNDIKNQSQQLEKYQKTFYQDLDSRKSPLQTQLAEQQHKRIELQTEIKQLQQKLKKKKSLLKSTLTSIQSTKHKISQVDQTFQQEKSKLQDRKKHITLLQTQKNQQNKKLLQIEAQINKLQKTKTQQVALMTKDKLSYNKLSTNIEAFFQSIQVQTYLSKKKHIIEQFMEHSRALKFFEQKHKQKREKIKDLQFQKSNTLSQITKNEQRIKQLKQRIPKLQTQQKNLSLAKNFKGAAMKKSQIKQCTDSIEQIKKQIQQAYATQAQIDSKIDQINSDQQKYIQQENQLRKSLAVSQFALAIEKKKQILKELDWLSELEKGNKMRELYEGKLKEELPEIDEEIAYIAQEYDLKQEEHKKQDNVVAKSANTKVSTKPQQKKIVRTINEPQSSQTLLALGDQQQNDQQAKEKSASSSNHVLQRQEDHKQQIQIRQDSAKEDLNEQSNHTQSRQQSVYEPLQLQLNDNNQEDQQEEQTNSAKGQTGQEDRQEDEQDGGYVPLQLD